MDYEPLLLRHTQIMPREVFFERTKFAVIEAARNYADFGGWSAIQHALIVRILRTLGDDRIGFHHQSGFDRRPRRRKTIGIALMNLAHSSQRMKRNHERNPQIAL